MIGSKQIIIDWRNWTAGMSVSPDVPNAGFSDETDGVNLTQVPGVLYAPASPVDSDTDAVLTDEIIASAPDHLTAGTDKRAVVTEDGKYYRYNGTKLGSLLGDDSASASQYQKGFTDMIQYKGATFITLKNNITKWSGISTFDFTWKASNFTNETEIHPALVFEDEAFYGDGNLLRRQSSASDTAINTILTLPDDDHIIALGIDRGSGKMLISTTSTLNFSNTLTSVNKLHWYDGSSNKVSKVIHVDDMITAIYSIGNTVMIGYGRNLGFLSGSGIQFLRRLKNVEFAGEQLPYKQNFANIGNTLYVVDGDQILAFGEVMPGQKVFYYAYKNRITADADFKCIFHAGSTKLGLSTTDSKFSTLDMNSVASIGLMSMYTNKIQFPRPVYLRSVTVEYLDAVPNNDNNRDVIVSDWVGTSNDFAMSTLRNSSGGNLFEIKNIIGFPNTKVSVVQFRYNTDTTNIGVKRIIIYYDFAE